MNDRELLELAAKACDYGSLCFWSDELGFMWDAEGFTWNPLNDDADALRLAVKLGLLVDCDSYTARPLPDSIGWQDAYEISDPYAATRRAIVRAAAEIGRTK
jgi:hypothetical protein